MLRDFAVQRFAAIAFVIQRSCPQKRHASAGSCVPAASPLIVSLAFQWTTRSSDLGVSAVSPL